MFAGTAMHGSAALRPVTTTISTTTTTTLISSIISMSKIHL